MCVLGMAEELKEDKIAVNALWPRTSISTAAMDMLAGKESSDISRYFLLFTINQYIDFNEMIYWAIGQLN